MTELAHNALAAKRVGQYLIDAGVLSAGQLDEALDRQRRMSKAGFHVLLGTILEEMGAIDRQSLEAIILRQRLDEGSVNLGPEVDWSPFRAREDDAVHTNGGSSVTDFGGSLSAERAAEAIDAFFGGDTSNLDAAATSTGPSQEAAWFVPMAPAEPIQADAVQAEAVESSLDAPAEAAGELEQAAPSRSWLDESLPRFPFFGRKNNSVDEAPAASADDATPEALVSAPTDDETDVESAETPELSSTDSKESEPSWPAPETDEPELQVDDEATAAAEAVWPPQENEFAPAAAVWSADETDSVSTEAVWQADDSESVAAEAAWSNHEHETAATDAGWSSYAEADTAEFATTSEESMNVTETEAEVAAYSQPETVSAAFDAAEPVATEDTSAVQTDDFQDDLSQDAAGSPAPIDLHGFKFSRTNSGLTESEVNAVIGQLIRRNRTLEDQIGEAKEMLSHLDSMRRYGEQSVKAADTIAQQIREEAEEQAASLREEAQVEARNLVADARVKHDEILHAAGAKALEVSVEIQNEIDEHSARNDAFRSRAQALMDTDSTQEDE